MRRPGESNSFLGLICNQKTEKQICHTHKRGSIITVIYPLKSSKNSHSEKAGRIVLCRRVNDRTPWGRLDPLHNVNYMSEKNAALLHIDTVRRACNCCLTIARQ